MTSAPREAILIADASPLMVLAKTGRLDLVHRLTQRLLVPRKVWSELMSGNHPDQPTLRKVLSSFVVDSDPSIAAAYGLLVDEGEAGALALAAQNPGSLILMDDARGRQVALAAGFRVMGTVGLMVRCARRGWIDSLESELDKLAQAGLFLSPRVVTEALRRAHEPPDAAETGVSS